MDWIWLACVAVLAGLMFAMTWGLQALETPAGDAP